MDHLAGEFLAYYHAEGPHQGKVNEPLTAPTPPNAYGDIMCRERLGGRLRHYFRRAA